MHFDQLLQKISEQPRPQIPPGWTQGRATFGGLVAAILFEAMHREVISESATDSDLRSLTFSFVGPASKGEIETRAAILRSGRSVTQVEGRAIQHGSVVIAALASYGRGRESSINVSADVAPLFKSPEESLALPYIPDIVPEFTQHFDYRIAEGGLPFSGSSENHLGGWVRFQQGEGDAFPLAISHLLALIDAWPPAILARLSAPAPASSLTWTIEFVEPLAKLISDQSGSEHWWQYLAEVQQAADGYAVIQARLWNKDGRLAAISRQTVTVFD